MSPSRHATVLLELRLYVESMGKVWALDIPQNPSSFYQMHPKYVFVFFVQGMSQVYEDSGIWGPYLQLFAWTVAENQQPLSGLYRGISITVFWYTADSKMVEHGCRLIYARIPSFFGLGLEDGRVPAFWHLL